MIFLIVLHSIYCLFQDAGGDDSSSAAADAPSSSSAVPTVEASLASVASVRAVETVGSASNIATSTATKSDMYGDSSSSSSGSGSSSGSLIEEVGADGRRKRRSKKEVLQARNVDIEQAIQGSAIASKKSEIELTEVS